MPYSFSDKTAIVTGSARGIGKAIARELCKRGARVVINDINEENLLGTVAEFQREGFTVSGFQADVTDYSACKQMVEHTRAIFGGVDILVNNAGISMAAFFKDMTPETFKKVLDLCTYGAVFPTKAALEEIIRNRGSIIFISSAGSFHGTASASAYTMGKLGIKGLAQTMRLELWDTGIHIGLIYPPLTQNDPGKKSISATGEEVTMAYRPAGLQISQLDVANAVINAISRRRKETILSWTGKLYVFMAVYFPGILFRILLSSLRRMKHLYKQS